jgi:hypothetical protein
MSEEIHVQSAPNVIAQGLHSKQELPENNKSRK